MQEEIREIKTGFKKDLRLSLILALLILLILAGLTVWEVQSGQISQTAADLLNLLV